MTVHNKMYIVIMQLSTVNSTVEIHEHIIGTDAALYRFLEVPMIIVFIFLSSLCSAIWL